MLPLALLTLFLGLVAGRDKRNVFDTGFGQIFGHNPMESLGPAHLHGDGRRVGGVGLSGALGWGWGAWADTLRHTHGMDNFLGMTDPIPDFGLSDHYTTPELADPFPHHQPDHFHNHGRDFLGLFGQRHQPWWKKENVCVETEEEEEDKEEKGKEKRDEEREEEEERDRSNFMMNFHVEMHSCMESEDRYVCTHRTGSHAGMDTVKTTYKCCAGFRLVSRTACEAVEEMKTVEQAMEDLGGGEFFDVLLQGNLTSLLHNVTVFLPDEGAMEEWRSSREESGLSQLTVYRVDETLMRKKRSLTLVQEPEVDEVITGHIISGYHSTSDLTDEMLLPTENTQGSKVRITKYGRRGEVIMANCAQITSGNHHASTGLIHTIDRVMQPATETILSILESDSQFKSFLSGLESHGLDQLLDQEGQFTVLAPTDEAFTALDHVTRDKILGRGTCAEDILRAHILPNVICSGVVQGRVSVQNILGHTLHMERDVEGSVMIDGIRLIIRDKMATNGVIHVLESVLLPPSLLPLTDYLHSHSSPLLDLLSTAGLTDTFSNLSNATLFLPSLSALSHYGETEMEIEKERLAEILLHHVVRDHEQKEGRGHSLDTAAGTRLRLSRHHHWGQGPVTTVQCARITGPESQVCGGRIVPIDRMLTPPEGDVMHTLERDHKEFAKLIKVAELDLDLSSGQYTVLAPVDSAFASLPEQTRNSMYSDPAMARMVVKSHLLRDPVCCAAIPRVSRMAVHTIQGNRLMLARNYGGRIYADRAAVVRCDQSAHNGVVHSVSRVLGHSPNSRTRGAHSQGAYNILAQPWLF